MATHAIRDVEHIRFSIEGAPMAPRRAADQCDHSGVDAIRMAAITVVVSIEHVEWDAHEPSSLFPAKRWGPVIGLSEQRRYQQRGCFAMPRESRAEIARS